MSRVAVNSESAGGRRQWLVRGGRLFRVGYSPLAGNSPRGEELTPL